MNALEAVTKSAWLRDEGYRANVGLPDIAGTFQGKSLLIVAGGRCVWDDLERADPFGWDVMVVNDIGMHLPCEIRHWFSMHGDQIPTWITARGFRYKNYDSRLVTHSVHHPSHTKYVWPWPGHGTSGLNAVYTGLGLGYDKIMVAGMPLDDSGHYFDPPDDSRLLKYEQKPAWTNFNQEANGRLWANAAKNVFDGRVEFLSGRAVEWTT